MAYSWTDVVATEGQQNFAFSIPYLSRDHIHVFVNGQNTEDFSFLLSQVVRLDTPASADDVIRVRRVTPIAEAIVDYADGSLLGEEDLDATALQSLYIAQELSDNEDNAIRANDQLRWDALNRRIINLGTPTATGDAVTKQYVDNLIADVEAGGGGASVAVHEAAADPHPGYQLESEKDANSGYAGLTTGGKIKDNVVVTASITDAAVTKAKIENVAASRLLGRGSSGAGAPQELSVSGLLSVSGTTLDASIVNGSITLPKIENISPGNLIGRGSVGGASAPEQISLGAGLTMSGTSIICYSEGTWTPGLNFETPGDAVIVLGTASGYYWRYGNSIHLQWFLLTTTFTHTTASGTIRITGIPLPSRDQANLVCTGSLLCTGLSCTKYLTSYIPRNVSYIAIGNNDPPNVHALLTHTGHVSGVQVIMNGSITYWV